MSTPSARGATIVIIPAFNEAATVAQLVERALVHAPVIVVDDGWFSRARLGASDVDDARPSPGVASVSHAGSLVIPPVLSS